MADRRTVPVTLDGVEVEAQVGESVLSCARRHDVAIPSLCHLEGLSVWGGCRLCVVEIAEDHRLRPACATPVAGDMEVRTNTAKLRSYRRSILSSACRILCADRGSRSTFPPIAHWAFLCR